nr:MAG TPA: hypothetical protein [Caudoviricetes sp.]
MIPADGHPHRMGCVCPVCFFAAVPSTPTAD